jgi:hypothetical protein
VTPIAEFLMARIAEDEVTAQEAFVDEHLIRSLRSIVRSAPIPGGEITHIVRWQPTRVLAECEAKRRVVELHFAYAERWGQVDLLGGEPDTCATCHFGNDEGGQPFPCDTLRLLALPYAGDHPDYDPAWRL